MPVAHSSRPSRSAEVHIDLQQEADLYARSGGSAYNLSQEQFTGILQKVIARTEEMNGVSPEKIASFLSGLKLDELALAHGCAAGDQHAWDVFLTKYRESIYQ